MRHALVLFRRGGLFLRSGHSFFSFFLSFFRSLNYRAPGMFMHFCWQADGHAGRRAVGHTQAHAGTRRHTLARPHHFGRILFLSRDRSPGGTRRTQKEKKERRKKETNQINCLLACLPNGPISLDISRRVHDLCVRVVLRTASFLGASNPRQVLQRWSYRWVRHGASGAIACCRKKLYQ